MKKKLINIIIKYRKRYCNEITYYELKRIFENNKNVYLIDVRSIQEYKENHIENAINIPVYEIEKKIEKVVEEKNSIIICYCQKGSRSKKSTKILNKMGYTNLYNLKNGFDAI